MSERRPGFFARLFGKRRLPAPAEAPAEPSVLRHEDDTWLEQLTGSLGDGGSSTNNTIRRSGYSWRAALNSVTIASTAALLWNIALLTTFQPWSHQVWDRDPPARNGRRAGRPADRHSAPRSPDRDL